MTFDSTDEDIPTRRANPRRNILDDSSEDESDNYNNNDKDNVNVVTRNLPPARRRTNSVKRPMDDYHSVDFSISDDALYPGLRTTAKSPRFNALARNFTPARNTLHRNSPLMIQSPKSKLLTHSTDADADDDDDDDDDIQCWSTDEEKTIVQQKACTNPYTSRRSTATAALLCRAQPTRSRDPSMAGAVQSSHGLWYRRGEPHHDIHALPLPSNWRPRNDLFGGSGVGTASYQFEEPLKQSTRKTSKKAKSAATTTRKTATKPKAVNIKKKGGGRRFKRKGAATKSTPRRSNVVASTTNNTWSSGHQHRSLTADSVSRKDATLHHVGGASITF